MAKWRTKVAPFMGRDTTMSDGTSPKSRPFEPALNSEQEEAWLESIFSGRARYMAAKRHPAE